MPHSSEDVGTLFDLGVVGLGTWSYSRDPDAVHLSRRALELLDYDEETADVTLDTWLDRVDPANRSGLVDALDAAWTDGVPVEARYRCRTAAGHARWHLARGRVDRDSEGAPVVFGILVDVTDVYEAGGDAGVFREALTQLEEPVLITDHDGAVSWANPAFELLTRKSVDELRGMTPGQLCSPASQGAVETLLGAASIRGIAHKRVWMDVGGDDSVLLDTVASRILADDGSVRGVLWLSRDVTTQETERRRELRRAKTEALSRLASSVIHDFNNHLTVIESGTRFALKAVEPDSQVAEDIREARDAGRRATELTKQLRVLDVRRRAVGSETDVGAWLSDEMRSRLIDLMGADVEVEVSVPDAPLLVAADRSQLEQILVNLATNAKQAMNEGGRFTVSAGITLHTTDPTVGDEPSEHVELTVSDTGEGIDPRFLDQIFDPFFTTRLQSTGLGLSTVLGSVRQLGGDIEVSGPGQRTVFRLRLPRLRLAE